MGGFWYNGDMLLDIAIGIFGASLIAKFMNVDPGALIGRGVLFSLLPDLDFIIYRIFRIHPDKGYKHRELFHYPLLYLPIGYLLLRLTAGQAIALTFALVSFLHFAHDSIAYGRGVTWLYPFDRRGYAFIYLYSRVVKKGLWQPIFIFDRAAIEKFDREHGDEEWIKHIFWQRHTIAIVELAGFLASLVYLYFLLT